MSTRPQVRTACERETERSKDYVTESQRHSQMVLNFIQFFLSC